MPTIHRLGGFRFFVNTDDHGYPHVHVRKDDGTAKIVIGDGGENAWVLEARGLSEKELRLAVRVVDENAVSFLEAWRRYHGEYTADG
jgi:hypothetical protein